MRVSNRSVELITCEATHSKLLTDHSFQVLQLMNNFLHQPQSQEGELTLDDNFLTSAGNYLCPRQTIEDAMLLALDSCLIHLDTKPRGYPKHCDTAAITFLTWWTRVKLSRVHFDVMILLWCFDTRWVSFLEVGGSRGKVRYLKLSFQALPLLLLRDPAHFANTIVGAPYFFTLHL